MTTTRFLTVAGFSALLLVGCAGTPEPELSLMEGPQAQVEIPAHVAENNQDKSNITYIGRSEDFRVFAARDGDDRWCVLLEVEPPADFPDEWHIGESCAPSEDFAEGRVWVQSKTSSGTHTAQLLPDDFTGEIDPNLERINDNLAAK